METKIIELDNEKICDRLSDYTIGFTRFTLAGGQLDGEPAGTGTLVSSGDLFGILTAAHVLDALPDNGEVGLVRWLKVPSEQQLQAQRMEMSHARKVTIYSGNKGKAPDLGFLVLPPMNVGNLQATNSFVNLDRLDPAAVMVANAKASLEAIAGMIGIWTTDVAPRSSGGKRKSFSGLLFPGQSIRMLEEGGFDIREFDPKHGDEFEPPESYGGVSGGGLWQVYLAADAKSAEELKYRFLGVPYYQSEVRSDGDRHILCHGTRGILQDLLAKVRTASG